MAPALRLLLVAQLAAAAAALRRALPAEGPPLQDDSDPEPLGGVGDGEVGLVESVVSRVVARVVAPRASPGVEAMSARKPAWPAWPLKLFGLRPKAAASRAAQPARPLAPAWVFSAHHKAGTRLLKHLAAEQASAMNFSQCHRSAWAPNCSALNDPTSSAPAIWFLAGPRDWERSEPKWRDKDVRFVDVIRDPVAMVVSGYIFNTRRGADVPRDTPPALRREAEMPMKEGMTLEAQWVVNQTGLEMDLITKGIAERTTGEGVHTRAIRVRFEDFDASPESFDATAAKLYNFTVGDVISRASMADLVAKASLHDLHRHPDATENIHVAPEDLEKRAEEALRSISMKVLEQLHLLREKLGY